MCDQVNLRQVELLREETTEILLTEITQPD